MSHSIAMLLVSLYMFCLSGKTLKNIYKTGIGEYYTTVFLKHQPDKHQAIKDWPIYFTGLWLCFVGFGIALVVSATIIIKNL